MKKMFLLVAFLLSAGLVYAQMAPVTLSLKGVPVATLTPQGQQVVDEAKKLPPAQQENFILTQAKTLLTQQNMETAMGLAQYVITNMDAKSLTAQKIMTDAKAMLQKKVQDHLTGMQQQATAPVSQTQAQAGAVKADATKTVSDMKNLFGSFGSK